MRLTTKRPTAMLHTHLRARVEGVADAVAEDVERQHGQHEHQAGHDRLVRRGDDRLDAVADHRPPGRLRGPHAGAEERQRRLEQDRVGDHQREEDDDRRRQVGQDLGEHDPDRPDALRPRRLDELLLAQREHLPAQGLAMYGTYTKPMISIGMSSESPLISIGPICRPPSASAVPSATPSSTHRKRPDDVEAARDQRVDPAAEEAGQRSREDRQQDRQQRRANADRQRRCARRTAAGPRCRGRPRRRRGRSSPSRSARSARRRATTTSTCLPSTVILSVMWPLYGSVCATCSAYSGADRHRATMHDEQRRRRRARRCCAAAGAAPAAPGRLR